MDLTLPVMTSEDDCIACTNGTFCPVGSANATLCAAGTYNAFERRDRCDKCSAGRFQDAEGATVCKACRGRGAGGSCAARTLNVCANEATEEVSHASKSPLNFFASCPTRGDGAA